MDSTCPSSSAPSSWPAGQRTPVGGGSWPSTGAEPSMLSGSRGLTGRRRCAKDQTALVTCRSTEAAARCTLSTADPRGGHNNLRQRKDAALGSGR